VTGTTPLEKKRFRDAAWDEMRRLIREEEAPRPSLRLSSSDALPSLAARRQVEPAKLSRLIRGDLDWIVLKALEKDRNRRYETANGLAMDVQRHLADEPVLACPPSVSYRVRKFSRKHRAGLLATAAIAALLLLSAAVSNWQAIRAKRAEELAIRARDAEAAERQEAEQQRDRALAAERQAQSERDKAQAARALADRTRYAIGLEEKLAPDFTAVPRYRHSLAGSYHNLGLLLKEAGQRADAEVVFRLAVIMQMKLVTDFPDVPTYRDFLARHLTSLGNLLQKLGRQAEAEAAHRQALAIREKLAADSPTVPSYRRGLADSQQELGIVLRALGKWQEAEAAYRHARTIEEKLVADFPAIPAYRVSLAGNYVNSGELVNTRGESLAALDWYAKSIPLLEATLAQDPQHANAREFLRVAYSNRATALRRLARYAEAVRECDCALALVDDALNDPTTRSEIRLSRAAAVLAQTGDHARTAAEAEELTRGDKVSGEALYAAAGVFGLASATAKDDDKRREAYAVQAVVLLRRARAANFFGDGGHVEELKTDPDLKALQARQDFQALVKQLEPKE
jgi:tetratricopeptide (TPR) repeat protein